MKHVKGYGTWDAPPREPQQNSSTSAEDIAAWRALTKQAATLAAKHDWSKTEFARRAGEASATFSEWYNGRHAGRFSAINARIKAFLDNPAPTAPEGSALDRMRGAGDRWEPWTPPRHEPELDTDELTRWKRLTAECAAVAERYSYTKAEVSRRSGVPSGTFHQWYDGSYKGTVRNVSDKIESWLRALKEMAEAAAKVPAPPGYVQTPTSREIADTLLYAQLMSEMVIITLGAGMGKTMTVEHYRKTNPHAFVVTMRPSTKGVYNMIQEIARVLEVHERNPAKLDSALGEVLKRNGRQTLLMIDEAQVLTDDAVNQLRHFLDVYGVGIALIGNEELYGRFGGQRATPSYAQIHRRIGKRLRRMQPLMKDIDALIDAWGVEDKETRGLLRAIGRKPGALSQITKTMQLAGMYARGEGRELQGKDIRRAWTNRGAEEL